MLSVHATLTQRKGNLTEALITSSSPHLQHEFGFGIEVCFHIEVVLESTGDVKCCLTLWNGALYAGASAFTTQRADQ